MAASHPLPIDENKRFLALLVPLCPAYFRGAPTRAQPLLHMLKCRVF